ncbi:unnamed protein product [Prorocentrum cordatum]|uniref:Uncharacterized protein n=1 Tax=Prorocentrum cordatum TaxID=2364126 RepID=A0ABN9SWN6_9DINO|nr:unnamed protein product [Polarella glacialis]
MSSVCPFSPLTVALLVLLVPLGVDVAKEAPGLLARPQSSAKAIGKQQAQAFAAMSEEHYATACTLLTAAQRAQVAHERAQQSGDPRAVSRAAQEEHGQLKSKLGALGAMLEKAAHILKTQLQRVVELRLQQKSLLDQERLAAEKSHQAWTQIAGARSEAAATEDTPEKLLFQRFDALDPRPPRSSTCCSQPRLRLRASGQLNVPRLLPPIRAAPAPDDGGRELPVGECEEMPGGDDSFDASWADADNMQQAALATLGDADMAKDVAAANGVQQEQVANIIDGVVATAASASAPEARRDGSRSPRLAERERRPSI